MPRTGPTSWATIVSSSGASAPERAPSPPLGAPSPPLGTPSPPLGAPSPPLAPTALTSRGGRAVADRGRRAFGVEHLLQAREETLAHRGVGEVAPVALEARSRDLGAPIR